MAFFQPGHCSASNVQIVLISVAPQIPANAVQVKCALLTELILLQQVCNLLKESLRTIILLLSYGNHFHLLKGSGESSTTVARSCLQQELCSKLNADASGITYSASLGVGSFFGFLSCCNTDNCSDTYIPG